MFAPLKKHGCGPGKRVGIIGIGGLGHFGLLFAKALGASKIVAVSRSSSKRNDALSMGADDFIATGEDSDWATKHRGSLDLIISTLSASDDMPFSQYLGLLAFGGTMIQVGAPETGLPAFDPSPLLFNRVTIAGSLVGTRKQIQEMLDIAASENVKPWIQTWAMEKANEALVAFEEGAPRYRFVLCN